MKIVNPEKIERFEQLLHTEISTDKDIVAHTIDGRPITKEQYIEYNNQAEASFKKGKFKTQDDMLKKYGAM